MDNLQHSAPKVINPEAHLSDEDARSALRRAVAESRRPGRARLATRHDKIAQHRMRMLDRALSAIGAPPAAHRFFSAMIEAVGWTPEPGIRLTDLQMADAIIGPVPRSRRSERETEVARTAESLARIRQRLIDWQGKEGNPKLFEYDGRFNPDLKQRECRYHHHYFLDVLRAAILDTSPDSAPRYIDQAIHSHCSEYLEEWTGSATRTRRKRESAPEADLHRAATVASQAAQKEIARLGEERAADVFLTEFWAKFADKIPPNFANYVLAKLLPGQEFSSETIPTTVGMPETQECNDLSDALVENGATLSNTCQANSDRPALGQSIDDFTRETFPDKPIDYRLPKPSDDYLSLAEIEAFDPRGSGGNQRRFRCPACQSKQRQLTVNMTTGAYQCKRGACGVKGKLREYFTQGPVIPGHRRPQFGTRLPEPPPAPESETWRRWLAKAKPVSGTPGADYLTWRGIPAEIASAAGVQFGEWRQDGQPFEGVIFSIHNATGELVAAQARAIEGEAKNTRGPRKDGVFLATPGALDAPEVAIAEAPIDALALAAAGLPAIALCGVQWPEWLLDRLAGRRIYAAFDADEAGDKAADELVNAFAGRALVSRFRPRGAKDWAAVAKSYGISAIEAEL